MILGGRFYLTGLLFAAPTGIMVILEVGNGYLIHGYGASSTLMVGANPDFVAKPNPLCEPKYTHSIVGSKDKIAALFPNLGARNFKTPLFSYIKHS